ncbi:hypothetical protein, partial [Candidatus Pantoea formicae]|uniref:hypothetical protein n=1 Tax=Candidatus Pantoea formicae TaxID=2608355 RepID=UPI0019662091
HRCELHRGAGQYPIRRRIDLSKPLVINQNQGCKNGGDHRFFMALLFTRRHFSFLFAWQNS